MTLTAPSQPSWVAFAESRGLLADYLTRAIPKRHFPPSCHCLLAYSCNTSRLLQVAIPGRQRWIWSPLGWSSELPFLRQCWYPGSIVHCVFRCWVLYRDKGSLYLTRSISNRRSLRSHSPQVYSNQNHHLFPDRQCPHRGEKVPNHLSCRC